MRTAGPCIPPPNLCPLFSGYIWGRGATTHMPCETMMPHSLLGSSHHCEPALPQQPEPGQPQVLTTCSMHMHPIGGNIPSGSRLPKCATHHIVVCTSAPPPLQPHPSPKPHSKRCPGVDRGQVVPVSYASSWSHNPSLYMGHAALWWQTHSMGPCMPPLP